MAVRMLVLVGWVVASFCAAPAALAEQQKLLVYSSMKESLLGELKSAFARKRPDIQLDYQTGGAGKLMARIAAERDSGAVLADMLWTSEVPDFYQLKAQGLLSPYTPAEIKSVVNPFKDYDGSFTAVRLGTMGIAYNTRFVKEAPKAWQDAQKAMFKDAYGVANPALSGTACMGIAMLVKAFGWGYFEALHANGAKVGKGSGSMAEETALGDLLASMATDSVVNEKIENGATLALAYPPEMLVIPSPVAILKGSANVEAARMFVDFLLSSEGQTIIANAGKLPVRPDVVVPERFNLPTPADAMKRAIKVDYQHLMAERDATIKRFREIMQKEVGEKR